MKRFILTGLLFAAFEMQAQIVQPVNSGKIWEKASALIEQDKPEEALLELEKVDRNDTNYVYILEEKTALLLKMKRYPETIVASREGLSLNAERAYGFYNNLGLANLRSGNNKEALNIFDEALKKYPKNFLLYYNKGVAYQAMKKLPEALEMYKKSIQINPFYSFAHYSIGLLAAEEGKVSQAILAINTFLLLERSPVASFTALKKLNEIVSSRYEKTPTGLNLSPEGGDDFSETDLIITNYVALNSAYKIPVKTDLSAIKQNHVLLSKLEASQKGFFSETYVPFYREIFRQDKFSAFSYYILQGSQNESHKKLVKKHIAEINAFSGWFIKYLEKMQGPTVREVNGKEVMLTSFYDKENLSLDATGTLSPTGVPQGYFEFWYGNGNLVQKGNFSEDGKMDGAWYSYHKNGSLSKELNYKKDSLDGSFRIYFENGKLQREGIYVNGKQQGIQLEYNEGGLLIDRSSLKDDKLDGPTASYYNIGEKHREYEGKYVQGKITDTLRRYFANGALALTKVLTAGVVNGDLKDYYSTGQLRSVTPMKNDKPDGLYTSYFPDGKKYEEGEYKEGLQTGTWKTFYKNGIQATESAFDNKGKLNGIYREHDKDGRLFYEFSYVKGVLNTYRYYDKNGKILSERKKESGTLQYKSLYTDGIVESEGTFAGENKTGLWKYYNEFGRLTNEEPYNSEGKLEGVMKVYFPDGKLKKEVTYHDGKNEGYYAIYYHTGQKSQEGWYSGGELNGYIAFYSRNGKKVNLDYYVNGKKHGYQQEFDINGKLNEEQFWKNDRLLKIWSYDTTGTLTDSIILPEGTGKIVRLYNNGNERFSGNYVLGLNQGDFSWKYWDGKPRNIGRYLNDKKEGTWTTFHENGKTESECNFTNGLASGKWNFYYPGGKLHKTFNYELDEVEGEGIWYYENGQPETKKFYENDKEEGEAFYYTETGDVEMVRTYHLGKPVKYTWYDQSGNLLPAIDISSGTYKAVTYYKNGNKSREFEFINGMCEGKYVKYYPSGKIKDVTEYVNDIESGMKTEYYPDGKLKSEKPYTDGELHGTEKFYYPNGNPEKEQNYHYGTLQGKSVWYLSTGKISKTEIYNNGICTGTGTK